MSTQVVLARVVAGVVEILQDGEYNPATDVLMLNNGAEDSEGIVIINGLVSRYMTNTQLDTAFILNKLLAVTEQAINVADNATYVIGGVTPVYGKMAAFVPVTASLTAIKQEIEGHKIT